MRALEARVAFERAALRDARVEADRHAAAAAELRAVAMELHAKSERLERELWGVYTGRSWRLTRPLRWIIRQLRGHQPDEAPCNGDRTAVEEALGCRIVDYPESHVSDMINEAAAGRGGAATNA